MKHKLKGGGMPSRPDRDEWHLDGCDWLAAMGDCTRSGVGSLIVVEKRIVGLGYNGGRPGGPSCLEGACPRGRHYDAGFNKFQVRVCGCGSIWPCPDAVAPGSSYDTGPGACISTHAEHNAVDDAKTKGAGRMAGGVQYVSREPCDGCVRMIRNNTDIEAVIWRQGVIALP